MAGWRSSRPLSPIAPAIRPLESGDAISALTAIDPADSPLPDRDPLGVATERRRDILLHPPQGGRLVEQPVVARGSLRPGAHLARHRLVRALARTELERCGGPGVGVVGMCFTGGFALGMLAEPAVLAPVLSQPSLPMGTAKSRRDLGISDADLAAGRERVEADDICVLGLRFTGDKLSPPERFERLRAEFGENFVGVEIDSSPENVHHIRKLAHSVLTEDLVDEPGHPTQDALGKVLDLFRTRLLS